MDWKKTIDYSLVICTYNPDERILKRCLEAVSRLDTTGIATEVILVDNNSNVPLQQQSYVKAFKGKIPGMHLLLVQEQGVNFARMAAIEKAAGNYIVYFDYDNEPESDYLQELKKLNEQFPRVAAWGPGNVKVDFIDGVDASIRQFASAAFQQREEQTIRTASESSWQSCYPFGTGLCTLAPLLKEFVLLAREGRFTASGRKGNKLSSGEDTQMVLHCISKGYAAGVAPSLKLTHIIPQQRANNKYLQRLLYGTFMCYETCLLQVFPEQKKSLEQKIISPWKFSRKSVKKFFRARWSKDPHKMFDLVHFIAIHAGTYAALNKPVPLPVNQIVRILKVE